MKLLTLCAISLIALAGCAGGIDSVDTKEKNQACVRQCTEPYSNCISKAYFSNQHSCASGFRACANACPDKQLGAVCKQCVIKVSK